MKKIKKWLYDFIREAVNDEQDKMYTVFRVYDEKGKAIQTEICLTFKPSEGDYIEFDFTTKYRAHDEFSYFFIKVKKVVYSSQGCNGKIYGEKVLIID